MPHGFPFQEKIENKNFCPRLGERELVAHNVSKRYLENLRREAWKGRRGSVERGKTYQENFERGKPYQENFAARRESFQSKTKSLES